MTWETLIDRGLLEPGVTAEDIDAAGVSAEDYELILQYWHDGVVGELINTKKSKAIKLDADDLRKVRKPGVVYVEKYNREHQPAGAPGGTGGEFAPKEGGGGGGGNGGGDGDGARAKQDAADEKYLRADGKYDVGDDVDAAVRLIGRNKDVVLDQPRELSTLLDKLADIGKSGDKRVYDLCRVSVEGTNLFCAETVGYARVDMPQLATKNPIPGSIADSMPRDARGEVDAKRLYIESLRGTGHTVIETEEDAGYLRASQRELDGVKVAGMMKALQSGKLPPGSIVVSKDNYVIDGHHRWAAQVALGYTAQITMPMAIEKVDIGVIELLKSANTFAERIGIPSQKVGAKAFVGCRL